MLIECICRRCGVVFIAPSHYLPIGRGLYCSKPCAWGTPEDRFRAGLPPPSEGCWEWRGLRSPSGYGRMKADYKEIPAHRFSYELHIGPIPAGLFVLHRCDNRACVNPAHLFLGTAKDNAHDMHAKGRQSCVRAVGEAARHARLTEAQVREIRALHAAGGVTYAELGRRFGVGKTTLSAVVRRMSWRHLLPADHAADSISAASTTPPRARVQFG